MSLSDPLSLVSTAISRAGIIPDVIPDKTPFFPEALLVVKWPTGKEAILGNMLTTVDTADEPSVSFTPMQSFAAATDVGYTLVMTDPDAPSRSDPKMGQWRHWVLDTGDLSARTTRVATTPYYPPAPPRGTGPHRYDVAAYSGGTTVFLLYQEPSVDFVIPADAHECKSGPRDRARWNAARFAERYSLKLLTALDLESCASIFAMARKLQTTRDASSDDDDAPDMVSHATSKADAKRSQKALDDFAIEERARKKARNRERDQKLKERTRVTKGAKTGHKSKVVRFMQGGDEGDLDKDEDEDEDDSVEARMLRAMRDAADEVESEEGEPADDDDEFKGLGFGEGIDLGDDMASGSDASFEHGSESDEDMDEEEENETAALSTRRTDYLADDLIGHRLKRPAGSTQKQTVKKRRRKSVALSKDLVIGYVITLKSPVIRGTSFLFSGRTVRTLPPASDPRSQPTARTVPSARARKFVDQNLALKGKRALLKAKKKGWERRPANVGVMKYQGAPHGFVRSTR
ncbi:phosphatidylethanolamine-binding protein [Chiua virens]|nr:phosphatidylethanolamine-binding protein [Chiua virens]